MPDAQIFVRDIETRSTVDLKEVGLHNYATHPSTDILTLGYCINGDRVKLWHPGDPVPGEYWNAAQRSCFAAVAHNAPFEMAIERYVLAKRYGFPIIPIERNVCTMAIANALALPAKLEKLAGVLDLEHQKDMSGNRVMLQMSKPRRPRKSEDPNGIYWFDDAERLAKLDAYCIEDVEASREAAMVMPWLSDDEYQVWLLDQKINNRGIYIDQKLALAAQKIIKAHDIHLVREITHATNGQVTNISQVAKIKEWLAQYIEVTGLDKNEIEKLRAQKLPKHVRRVIELRAEGAQAAAKKVKALLAHRNSTGRVYDAFVYHAAGPGRWSSRGVQVHNLKRSTTADIEQAVEVIGKGDFNAARKVFKNPLSVIGDLIRAMIIAEPGNKLIGADFSGIEARVTAWFAGEESKLRVFRDFDAGKGPDPYIIAAAMVLGLDLDDLVRRYAAGEVEAREQRQIGKACELAFGFAGGIDAYRKFSQWQDDHGLSRDMLRFMELRKLKRTGNDTIDLKTISAEIDKIKLAWRKRHPNIQAMWRDLNTAMWRATKNPGGRVHYRDKLVFEHDGSTLWITLPSDRRLSYPFCRTARILDRNKTGGLVIEVERPKGDPALIFKDNASGQWRDVVVYGGLITENVVQGTARDLLAQAMLRFDAVDLPIVAHVHDEPVCEVPQEEVEESLPLFHRLMTEAPPWAEGLPIVAKTWSASRYVKG